MNWDTYFFNLCETVASKSPCLSRKIGSLLVKHHRVVATGYNGPPEGVVHCGHDRFMQDELLSRMIPAQWKPEDIKTTCPRRLLGWESGEGLEWCYAQHSEENCISTAARLGVCTDDCTLYINTVFPCQRCFGKLINAGVSEVVCRSLKYYDQRSHWMMLQTQISVREFSF